MPIKKRTHLPPPPPARRKVPDTYRLPGKPLEELLRECNHAASEAAWAGNDSEAYRLSRLAANYLERIEAGELYEIDH